MKKFNINRNGTLGESIENKNDTFFKIFYWKFDESEVTYNDEPYWHYGTAVWTAIRQADGKWTQTLLACNEDLGADGPLDYVVKRDSCLWSFEDVDILIREAFANAFAGRLDPEDDCELFDEWEGCFNLAYVTHEAYLDEEIGITNPKNMALKVVA